VASPLRWFRKNQKVMLIGFGVMLMIVFLLPWLFNSPGGGSGGSANDTVVARINGESVSERELDEERLMHIRTFNLLQQMQNQAASAAQARDMEFQPKARIFQPVSYDPNKPDETMRQLVFRRLALREAQQMGVVISDEAVYSYVSRLTGEFVSTVREIDSLTRQITNGIEFAPFREQIRKELMITQFDTATQVGLPPLPNLSRSYELFRKFNQRVECTVLEIPVADELNKITSEPTDSEIRELYAAGKDEYPGDPDEPGFKIGRQAAISYFKIDFQPFLQTAKNDVLPEDIEKKYQELVAEKSPLVTQSASAGDSLTTGFENRTDLPDAGQLPDSDDGVSSADDDAAPVPPKSDPGSLAPPRNDGQGSDSESGDPKSTEPAESGEAESGQPAEGAEPDSQEEGPGGGESADEPNEPNDDNQEDGNRLTTSARNSVHLASYRPARQEQQDPEPSTRESDPQAGETQDDLPENTGEDSAEAGEAAATQAPNAVPAAGDQAIQAGGADPQDVGEPAADEKEVEILPLEQVAEQIRELLASEPARANFERANQELAEAIGDYFTDYNIWKESDDEEDKPAPVDFEQVANDRRASYQELDMTLLSDFAQSSLGETVIYTQQPFMGRSEFLIPQPQRMANLLNERFTTLNPYQPLDLPTSGSDPETRYIIWIREKEMPQIPTFSEAKPQVIEFWRKRQAVQAALDRANQIAGQLSSASLKEKFPDTATDTGSFTWLNQLRDPTTGSVQVQVTDVNGVTQPGDEFMKMAFSLEPGQAGAAPNADRSAAYVIQVIDTDSRSEQEMREQFFSWYQLMQLRMDLAQQQNSQFNDPAITVHQQDIRSSAREYFGKLAEKYNVEFVSQ